MRILEISKRRKNYLNDVNITIIDFNVACHNLTF
jgi:hypothetical protein